MRAFATSLALGLLFVTPACKRRTVVAAPYVPPTAAAGPTETPIDALNPPPPPPRDMAQRADTANGAPDGPKQADLDTAQGVAQTNLQRCLDGLPPAATSTPVRLGVKYTVGNDGKATDVTVTGSGSTEMTACVTKALDDAPFPHFGGPKLVNSFTLSYSRARPADLSNGAR